LDHCWRPASAACRGRLGWRRTERSRATLRLAGEALREAQDDAILLALREQEEVCDYRR
jgi:hypothetical protein